MHDPRLDAALARGATIVTPNKRLARELASRYDRAQLACDRAAWPSARVLPWMPFVGELVVAAQDAGLAVPAHRLDPAQSGHLWQRLVASELAARPLLDAGSLSDVALEAWEHVHAYGSGGESWRGFIGETPDVEAFARWAETYRRELARLDAVDGACAADVLVPIVATLPDIRSLDVVLAAFTELTPQQERFLDALQRAGARVERLPSRTEGPTFARLAECKSRRDEIVTALDWAGERIAADAGAEVGIVLHDLAQRRAEVRALAEERLCAALQWPGRHDAPRPYDISIGEPLADVPLVATALDLIALSHRPLARARAAVLVRSPFLPGAAAAWMTRAALERKWLDEGVGELDLRALTGDLARVDGELASRWRAAMRSLPRESRASPRDWIERWRGWLDAAGWIEGRKLSSAEYQAVGAWNELFGAFARLALATPVLAADDALATLNRLAREQLFQPEAPNARVRILGLLEATGLAFDALWIADMAADAWPRGPQPNPLLPIGWQREHGVPGASPARELDFARQVTAMLARAAPDVVFSYASRIDDHLRAPSPLVASFPGIEARPRGPELAHRLFGARPDLEAVDDRFLPAIDAGTRLPGGARLIEAQSACAFQAAACFRLRAQPWPKAAFGLTAMERGTLVHAAFASFWRAVHDHAQLVALDDAALDRAIAIAVAEASTELAASRWRALPPAVAVCEQDCVSSLLREWLVEVERPRPAFTVIETEARATLAVAGHPLDIRIDRIDALATGGVAVLDYKSGRASKPGDWFAPRPKGVQLGLYALAQSQRAPELPVRALAYGQLRRGELRAVGMTASTATWPGLPMAEEVKDAFLIDWPDALSRLTASVTTLASATAAGEAAIVPRDAKACSICHLAAVCRIGSIRGTVPDTEDADDA